MHLQGMNRDSVRSQPTQSGWGKESAMMATWILRFVLVIGALKEMGHNDIGSGVLKGRWMPET